MLPFLGPMLSGISVIVWGRRDQAFGQTIFGTHGFTLDENDERSLLKTTTWHLLYLLSSSLFFSYQGFKFVSCHMAAPDLQDMWKEKSNELPLRLLPMNVLGFSTGKTLCGIQPPDAADVGLKLLKLSDVAMIYAIKCGAYDSTMFSTIPNSPTWHLGRTCHAVEKVRSPSWSWRWETIWESEGWRQDCSLKLAKTDCCQSFLMFFQFTLKTYLIGQLDWTFLGASAKGWEIFSHCLIWWQPFTELFWVAGWSHGYGLAAGATSVAGGGKPAV